MRRHDFDAPAFIFGLCFAAAGLVLLGGSAGPDGLALPWAGPIVAIGLALLIVFAVRPRGGREAREGADGADEGDPLEAEHNP